MCRGRIGFLYTRRRQIWKTDRAVPAHGVRYIRMPIGRDGPAFSPRNNSLRYYYNVGSLRSAVSFSNVECNGLAFLQSLVAVCYDTGEMYEYVLSVLRVGDEAVALGCVEPLNCALVHKMPPVKK